MTQGVGSRGYRNRGSLRGGGVVRQKVRNPSILHPSGGGGVVKFPVMMSPPPPSHARTTVILQMSGLGPKCSADLGPTVQAVVEKTESATFLAAWVAQVGSSRKQLGQP